MKRILILTAFMLVLIGSATNAGDDAAITSDAPMAPGMGMKCQVGGMMGPGMGMGCQGGGRAGMMGRGDCNDDDCCGGGCNPLDCKELNLTKEQTAKIKDLMFTNRTAMIDLKASMEKACLGMCREIQSPSPDRAKTLAVAREINAIKGKMQEARINNRFDIRAVLTPEQLEKYMSCQGECSSGKGMGCVKGMGCGKGGDGCKKHQIIKTDEKEGEAEQGHMGCLHGK